MIIKLNIIFLNFTDAYEVSLFAPIDAINIRGNITFYQPSVNSPVQINVHLNFVRSPKQDYEEKFEW